MTNLNITKLIDDTFDALEEALGIKPKKPTEEPTAPDVDEEHVRATLNFLNSDEVSPQWESIELLRKAEIAADEGREEQALLYIGIADRYINLADIFSEVEITFSE